MSDVRADPGSFRDPRGRVYRCGDRIFRTVSDQAAPDYEFVRSTELIDRLAAEGLVLSATEVNREALGAAASGARYVLEHPPIPFVSYPYEWCFSCLKAAALLHLAVQLRAFDAGVTLSDASAYNVQFQGARPVFIDHLSFRRYREGEIWAGYRQFCEQFLNPLLLRALLGVPHNAWYRGRPEGIPTSEIDRLIPLTRKLSWNVLSNVTFHAAFNKSAVRGAAPSDSKILAKGRLPPASYRGLLRRLDRWIRRLEPADAEKTVWQDYSATHSYSPEAARAKEGFVAAMVSAAKPRVLWDMGCNTGDYARVALAAGAEYVVGFDFDQAALEAGFRRAHDEDLAFLPLLLDAANPSPNQGWAEAERPGLLARAPADAVLALAFIHHLAIGRNIPLDRLVNWLIDLAPSGVIEFVPKSDPMVRSMLELREDIAEDYTEERFLELIESRARVVRSEVVQGSGRRRARLVWFERNRAG